MIPYLITNSFFHVCSYILFLLSWILTPYLLIDFNVCLYAYALLAELKRDSCSI